MSYLELYLDSGNTGPEIYVLSIKMYKEADALKEPQSMQPPVSVTKTTLAAINDPQ